VLISKGMEKNGRIYILVFFFVLVCRIIFLQWTWTKETGWVNIKKIKLGNAAKLYNNGVKLLKAHRCNEAVDHFIGAYRSAKTANLSQKILLNLAKGWLCLGHNYRAYSVMQLLTEKYPYTPYLDEIISLNYEIGFNFLKGAKKEIWGVKILPAKSIGHKIIQSLIAKYPYSKITYLNLLKYANFLYSTKDYENAYTYYKKFVELYPEKDEASFAVIRMFQSKQYKNPQHAYDKTNIEEMEQDLAKIYFKELKKEVIDESDYKKLKSTVENLKAKADFETAMFYLKVGKKQACITYLQSIIEEYPNSPYAKQAKIELSKLSANTKK
jgi:outer membrane protein assembly factor BamD (BamD/ComL family)